MVLLLVGQVAVIVVERVVSVLVPRMTKKKLPRVFKEEEKGEPEKQRKSREMNSWNTLQSNNESLLTVIQDPQVTRNIN